MPGRGGPIASPRRRGGAQRGADPPPPAATPPHRGPRTRPPRPPAPAAPGWPPAPPGPARRYHSLALDPFGNPAVAYRDDSTGDARLTYVPANIRGMAYAPVIRR